MQNLMEVNSTLHHILTDKINMSKEIFVSGKTYYDIYCQSFKTLYYFYSNELLKKHIKNFSKFPFHKEELKKKLNHARLARENMEL